MSEGDTNHAQGRSPRYFEPASTAGTAREDHQSGPATGSNLASTHGTGGAPTTQPDIMDILTRFSAFGSRLDARIHRLGDLETGASELKASLTESEERSESLRRRLDDVASRLLLLKELTAPSDHTEASNALASHAPSDQGCNEGDGSATGA
ncbi:hypothetical protein I317_01236 [Kwoniella heveanensis CBS 569]|nr:hypothetical protein I317_01236 [Kwoniella heveanensis CBS 569]